MELNSFVPELAISVRGACKTWRNGANVLDNLNVSVERGTIYGLLGPSGCGKTTLLETFVGLTQLDEGQVSVFGHTPGKSNSPLPGPCIGFMPQETALYDEFTAPETIAYFGRLRGLDSKTIEDETDRLFRVNIYAKLFLEFSGNLTFEHSSRVAVRVM